MSENASITPYTIDRVFEASRIRRGRQATAPVFVVVTADARWTFQRRKDAAAFVDAGGACPNHKPFCCECGGRKEHL